MKNDKSKLSGPVQRVVKLACKGCSKTIVAELVNDGNGTREHWSASHYCTDEYLEAGKAVGFSVDQCDIKKEFYPAGVYRSPVGPELFWLDPQGQTLTVLTVENVDVCLVFIPNCASVAPNGQPAVQFLPASVA